MVTHKLTHLCIISTEEGIQPRHRFMSSYEQKVEPPDKNYQYVLFACDPYETVGFKVRVFASSHYIRILL